jgi:phosphopantothenoylcysteine synthetase/decarboxylase
MPLKDKRVLITAGPTWVAIDSVRVISNTASGETGVKLAEALLKKGCRVTLVFGGCGSGAANKKIRVARFRFFDELSRILATELGKCKYDAIVHTAAVSDYKPAKPVKGKLSSDARKMKLDLVATPKLIDMIRRKAPSALLVGFKFLPEAAPGKLIAEARKLGRRSRANLVVANTVNKGKYRAFVVSPQGVVPETGSKEELVDLLAMYLEAFFQTGHGGKCACGKC